MKNPGKGQEKMKSIQFQVSEQEHEELLRLAKENGLTLKEYIRRNMTMPSENLVLGRAKVIQRMPQYYNTVKKIKDEEVQQQLEEFGGFLCQSLK